MLDQSGAQVVRTDVDKFWQQLNKKPAERRTPAKLRELLPDSPSQQATRFPTKFPDPVDQLQKLQVARSAGSYLAYEDLQSALQKDLQRLRAPSPAHRCQALHNLTARALLQYCVKSAVACHSCGKYCLLCCRLSCSRQTL